MIYIKAEYDGRIGVAYSQYAETVRLIATDGLKPVTEIREGDIIKAYVTREKIIEI